MNILVTGGTGFIGGYFIPLLLEQGHKVRLLVRDEKKARNQFGKQCQYHVGDVCDKKSLAGCCENIDIVYHLVAKSGNELPSKKNLELYRNINVQGTENLIEECSNIKKFIYISSTAAMGLVKDLPITEKSVCRPYLPYQVTKYEVEELIRKKCEEGFPGIIIRPTKVYGINEKDYSYLSLAKLIKRGFYLKIGNGHNYTSNIYVSDFASVLCNMCYKGNIGETYIVTSEKSIDFIEVGKVIADELGVSFKMIKMPAWIMLIAACVEEKIFWAINKKPIVTKRNIEMTIQDRVYDISKAKLEIGFEPHVQMQEGIRTVIKWYKKKGMI